VVEDYESHSRIALKNKDKYLGNPVNLYLLVKRFTVEFDDVIKKYVTNDTTKGEFSLSPPHPVFSLLHDGILM
jgi:hypothetical protein